MHGRKPELSGHSIRNGVGSDVVPAEVGTVRALEAPESLSPGAREIWETIVPDLASKGVYQPSDVLLLEQWCEAMDGARRSMAAAKAWEAGSLEEKRARASWADYMTQANRIAAEFGITPVARLRLGLMKLQGQSFLSGLKDALEGGE